MNNQIENNFMSIAPKTDRQKNTKKSEQKEKNWHI